MYSSQIDNYVSISDNYNNEKQYTEETLIAADKIFEYLQQICCDNSKGNHYRELWFHAERGPIEAWRDYEEMLEWGDAENREDYEEQWLSWNPDPEKWYHFAAAEDNGYRVIQIGHRLCITLAPETKPVIYGRDISELLYWCAEEIERCIAELKSGVYNEKINNDLPPQHRCGTISRKDFWAIFPEEKESYLNELDKETLKAFLALAEQQEKMGGDPPFTMDRLTAADFFRCAHLGYIACRYDAAESMTDKESYYRFADGRDDGLKDIAENDPDAFLAWLHDRNRFGGHPWEVCRGGNSTHVDLYVSEQHMKGSFEGLGKYYFSVAADAYTRSIEGIKFFVAIAQAGYPVVMHNVSAAKRRLLGEDRIGFLPEGVFPRYCDSWFEREPYPVPDYCNLPEEKRCELAAKTTWYPETQVQLR